jgi:hypothetical protein
MLKTHKNQLINVIQEAGLSPALFLSGNRGDDPPPRGSYGGAAESYGAEYFALELKGFPLAFHIRISAADFGLFSFRRSQFVPGYPLSGWGGKHDRKGAVMSSGFVGLEDLLGAFSAWIQDTVQPYLDELEEPDLWSAYSADSVLMEAGSTTDDNTPFDVAEQGKVAVSLGEVRAFLEETHKPSDEERRFIDERLKYLEDAATRLGRKDWINIAAGVISNIAVGLALSPDTARGLFHIAGQALSWLLDVVRLLP